MLAMMQWLMALPFRTISALHLVPGRRLGHCSGSQLSMYTHIQSGTVPIPSLEFTENFCMASGNLSSFAVVPSFTFVAIDVIFLETFQKPVGPRLVFMLVSTSLHLTQCCKCPSELSRISMFCRISGFIISGYMHRIRRCHKNSLRVSAHHEYQQASIGMSSNKPTKVGHRDGISPFPLDSLRYDIQIETSIILRHRSSSRLAVSQ
jgi:hypothetical protein